MYGKLVPAEDSLQAEALPIGLAHNIRLKNPVGASGTVRWSDVEIDEADPVVRFRREMERQWLLTTQ